MNTTATWLPFELQESITCSCRWFSPQQALHHQHNTPFPPKFVQEQDLAANVSSTVSRVMEAWECTWGVKVRAFLFL